MDTQQYDDILRRFCAVYARPTEEGTRQADTILRRLTRPHEHNAQDVADAADYAYLYYATAKTDGRRDIADDMRALINVAYDKL